MAVGAAGNDIVRTESMMKSVEEMKVAASRLARGVVPSANPGIYSKTYPEGSDLFVPDARDV